MPDTGEKLVLDAWIDSNGYPIAILTESINPDNETDISDKVIRWGKITVTDGIDTAVMTGTPDKNSFPPYRYYTNAIIGRPGSTYSIRAEFGGKIIEATSKMPAPTPIEDVKIRNVTDNDTLRSVTLDFLAPADCPAYYYLTIRDLGNSANRRALPAVMSAITANEPNTRISVPVFMPKIKHDTIKYTSYPIVGQRIEINLCRVTKEVYDFWDDYSNMILVGTSEFIAGDNSLRGNIKGGYGIFSPQGVSRVVLAVE